MTVTILVSNGDVEISAPRILICVNVETKLSVMNSHPTNIAVPAPAAHGQKEKSHVPEAGCSTSVSLVKTGDVTLTMNLPCIWIITDPASRVPARRHVCQ